MPIKPENKSRYPANWKEIRRSVLERAQNMCEFCGIENHSIVERWRNTRHGEMELVEVKVVLTIAHMDNIPEHCDMDNLKALCQRCHLRYDHQLHLENARKTRLAAKLAARKDDAQLSLF